jgi:acyl-coenzyme A thioesterase PaaI-like protein
MAIPEHHSHLSSAFRRLPDIEQPKNTPHILNKQDYEHPFSRWMGLQLKSLKQGFARSEQSTNEQQINNRQMLHAAIPYSAAISTMAAVADISMTKTEDKSNIAVAIHSGLNFIKTIFPGDELEIVAKLDSTQKNLRYISADIIRKVQGGTTEIVAKAISTFAITPKQKLGLT